MHQIYYNLKSDPFRLSPDPRFCLPHRTYRQAMTYIRHALLRAEGFIIITGQPGMGKTTLINDLLRELSPNQLRVARLVSTQLQADDLLRLVAFELDLDPAGMDKASLLNQVGHFLRQQHREGSRTLLVVDEAQDVTVEALEELRLLTNIEVDGQQLLQIFLVGQERLRDAVSDPSLVQLHQRVIAATHLEPLDSIETREYIKHRLRRVGWEGDPQISNQAYAMIHRFSQGIPRQINQICSRLLLHGSIEERHRLGLQDLRAVIEELHREMLLPLGMQEIAGTMVWPTASQAETWDDQPRLRPELPATTDASSSDLARQPDNENRPTGIIERMSPNVGTSGMTEVIANDSTPDAGPAADPGLPGVAPAGIGQPVTRDRQAPAASGDSRPARRGRKRNPWRGLGISALIAGLLLGLLLAGNTDTGNQLRTSLLALTHSGSRDLPAALPATPGTATPPPVEKDTTPATGAAAISGIDPERDIALVAPAAGHVKVTGIEPARAARAPVFSVIKAELAASGLRVENRNDGSLKINLSSVGMFEFDSTRLNDSAGADLARIAGVLNRHAGAHVDVVGHTDSSGEPAYNVYLSQLRAEAVANYLIRMGLPEDHIQSEGRGDQDTRHEEATRDNPDLRRRVEIYIRPVQEG